MVAHALATLDPVDPDVRAGAQRLADRLAADPEKDSEVGRAVRSILDNVSHGERVVVLLEDQDVTPAQAAEMLGVSRQFVDRIIASGVLEAHRLPDSTHRRIKVADVVEVAEQRARMKAGHAAITKAFEDMGHLEKW
jgi:excisionase family DNA binding protein